MFLRTPYNYDRDQASDESGLRCEDPSLTKQSFKDECDLNVILERFALTGRLPENPRMPTYGDFMDVSDYHTAMNAVRAADEAFMALPAAIRARFGNDPGAYVDFCSDEKNREEAARLGLLKPEAFTPPASQVPGTPEAAQEGASQA